VAFFQAQWSAALDDTCTIDTNAAGKGTYNTGTHTYDGTPTTIYGPAAACLFRPGGASSTQFAEKLVNLIEYELYLPHDAPATLAPDQQVTVNGIGSPTVSGLLVGQVLTVIAVEKADSYNARTVLGLSLNRGGG
jgi:hypothetical protein